MCRMLKGVDLSPQQEWMQILTTKLLRDMKPRAT